MDSNISGALIAGLFTILGVVVGRIVTQTAAREAAFEESFIRACEEFKKKWVPHYLRVKYADKSPNFNNTDWPFETAFELGRNGKLFVSVDIFERYLKGKKAVEFHSECSKLFDRYEENGMLKNIALFSSNTPGSDKIKATKNLLNVLDKIISFAEPDK